VTRCSHQGGYWEITIDAMTPDKVEDTVVYKFCIPA